MLPYILGDMREQPNRPPQNQNQKAANDESCEPALEKNRVCFFTQSVSAGIGNKWDKIVFAYDTDSNSVLEMIDLHSQGVPEPFYDTRQLQIQDSLYIARDGAPLKLFRIERPNSTSPKCTKFTNTQKIGFKF